MFSASGRKPYTAVTQYIDRLTGPGYEEDDMTGIVDLLEAIKIQDSGPTEAARAIRKKLKYGSTDRQLRALTLLDAVISNGGPRFQRHFVDEPLLERLRILPRDEMVDIDVRNKCNMIYKQWAVAFKDVQGLQPIATLYKQLPTRARPAASQSKVIRETEQEAAEDLHGPSSGGQSSAAPGVSPTSGHRRNVSHSSTPTPDAGTSTPPRRASHAHLALPSSPAPVSTSSSSSFLGHSRKSSKNSNKPKPFNLEKEKSTMLQSIAGASVASTNLTNALKLINRESQRVSDDSSCKQRFDQCKLLRRQILRYIQLVESEQWIGSLLTANDELVKALMAYEVMDKSVEDDSDSEAEGHGHGHGHGHGGPVPAAPTAEATGLSAYVPPRKASLAADLAQLRVTEQQPPAKPPRPGVGTLAGKARQVEESDEEVEEVDENDPFGDQNEIR